MAKEDFEEAKKLQKEGETNAEKWLTLTEADRLHEEKISNIMANAEALKGKEYIDYLLTFLKGKKDGAPNTEEKKNKKKRVPICHHRIEKEESEKLAKILEDEDMVYYFNVNDGMKILVDSLYISTEVLPLIQTILEKNQKL